MLIEETADAAPLTNETRVHRVELLHPGCDECTRLYQQARAAVLTHDRSRLADVRITQERHETAEHPDQ